MSNVIVPLVTPFKSEDLFSLIDHVLNGGVSDVLLYGTTGEAKYIDIETKKSVIRDVVAHVNNRARVYVGIITDSLQEAINLQNYCTKTGVFASLFPPVSYGNDFFRVFINFLKSSSGNIILYGLPKEARKPLPLGMRMNRPKIFENLCVLRLHYISIHNIPLHHDNIRNQVQI